MEKVCYQYSDITVQPTHLEFEFQEGSQFVPSPKAVRVRKKSEGDRMPYWKAYTYQDWVDTTPDSGKDPKNVYIHIRASALNKPAGVYTAKVAFTATPIQNTPIIVDVVLTIKPAVQPQPCPPPELPPPKVYITYPRGGETFFVGDTVRILWTVDRKSGTTLDVYLSVDGKWVTLATDIRVDDGVYPWRVEKTHLCKEGIIQLSSVSICSAPQSGPFRVRNGKWVRIVNMLLRFIEWLKGL